MARRALPPAVSVTDEYLRAVVHALDEIRDLLDDRLPQPSGQPVVDISIEGGVVALREPATPPAPEPEPALEAQPGPATVDAPPRTGRGSGTDAWRTFADANNVTIPADASRDAVIFACEAAGVIDRKE